MCKWINYNEGNKRERLHDKQKNNMRKQELQSNFCSRNIMQKYLCYTMLMEVISTLIDIENNFEPSVEYIEKELTKRNIEPLRWAVVNVSDKIITVNVAKLVK